MVAYGHTKATKQGEGKGGWMARSATLSGGSAQGRALAMLKPALWAGALHRLARCGHCGGRLSRPRRWVQRLAGRLVGGGREQTP